MFLPEKCIYPIYLKNGRVKPVRSKALVTTENSEKVDEAEVIIIGAGLAGLSAARELHNAGHSFILLEKSDGAGGRVRTDKVDGFLLDRGFQIFLSAYPFAQEILDYEKLDLKPFYAGAKVRFQGSFHRVADPFRHPVDGVISLANPIGSIFDKVKVGIFRFKCLFKSYEDILSSPEIPIAKKLEEEGFSNAMIDRFFRPFLGGIFFDRGLTTTSRLLEFVIRVLALGANTLPVNGIGAISEQLASSIPSTSIRLNAEVRELRKVSEGEGAVAWEIVLRDGRVIHGRKAVIIATEGPEARKLTALLVDDRDAPSQEKIPRSTVCLYFSSEQSDAIGDPVLFLNGEESGVVNNVCFPSAVSPSYAPPGKALVSVSLIGDFPDKTDKELEAVVREEVKAWFGSRVDKWQHLRTYRIPYAQPDQTPPTNFMKETQVASGLYVCGDHRDSATFDGALISGARAAKKLLANLQ